MVNGAIRWPNLRVGGAISRERDEGRWTDDDVSVDGNMPVRCTGFSSISCLIAHVNIMHVTLLFYMIGDNFSFYIANNFEPAPHHRIFQKLVQEADSMEAFQEQDAGGVKLAAYSSWSTLATELHFIEVAVPKGKADPNQVLELDARAYT